MYYVKNQIFLSLTKTQKSTLCNFLRALVKKSSDCSEQEILNKFIEDEEYYFKINNPHFEFLENMLFEDDFQKETLLYIKECKKYYAYKETQRPFIEKQKEFEKKKRKYLQDIKMQHEKPTKKQLYYYEKLCKKYNIEPKDTTELTKYDLKTLISEILDEYSRNSKNIDISGN